MSDNPSDTQVISMSDRRRDLKRQRQSKVWKATWRTTATLGLTLGLGWLFNNKPGWQITKASQVAIAGNTQISTQTLETFFPLALPTSLLRVQPGTIKTMLERNTHADRVSVNRQLFPPRILVQIQERPPVAIATCPNCLLVVQNPASSQPITIGPSDLWLIDDRGIALPYGSYPKLGRASKAPDLAVTGYLKPLDAQQAKAVSLKNTPGQPTLVALDADLQKAWTSAYLPIRRSPVKIQQIDWQKSTHLNLKTDLGIVQMGPVGSNISEQLLALDRMRALPQTVDPKNIKFINLENPKNPMIELNTVPASPAPQASP
jgi:cell division protein FtsQ